MKNTAVLIFSLAAMSAAFGVRADAPAPAASAACTIVEVRNPGQQPALAFVGADGKVVSTLDLPPENWGREKSRTTFVISPGRRFAAVNQISIRPSRGQRPEAETCVNRLGYYDCRGNVIFSKKNVRYQAVAVSANGEAIVCLGRRSQDYAGWGLETETSIIVLSRGGRDIFRNQEDDIDEKQIRISPGGFWLGYKHIDNAKVKTTGCKAVDLRKKRVYAVACGTDDEIVDIHDDGTLDIFKFAGKSAGGKQRSAPCSVNPRTNRTLAPARPDAENP